MPLYEYQCEQCGATFEVIQKFSDSPIDACRSCGGPAHRLLSAPAIHFKGTGWYITDYARKSGGGESAKEKKEKKEKKEESAAKGSKDSSSSSSSTTSATSSGAATDKK